MSRTRSREEQSAIVSGAGFLAAFADGLMQEVKAQGGTDHDIHRLVTKDGRGTLRKMAALVVSSPIVAPDGSRVHIVRVPVNPAREWQEAVSAAGPNTLQNFDVRKVGDNYPPKRGEIEENDIILVNFGKTIPDGQRALDCAEQYKLRPKGPRGCFAVGEHKPNLDKELGMNPMSVISLAECAFGGRRHACGV